MALFISSSSLHTLTTITAHIQGPLLSSLLSLFCRRSLSFFFGDSSCFSLAAINSSPSHLHRLHHHHKLLLPASLPVPARKNKNTDQHILLFIPEPSHSFSWYASATVVHTALLIPQLLSVVPEPPAPALLLRFHLQPLVRALAELSGCLAAILPPRDIKQWLLQLLPELPELTTALLSHLLCVAIRLELSSPQQSLPPSIPIESRSSPRRAPWMSSSPSSCLWSRVGAPTSFDVAAAFAVILLPLSLRP
ncbi:hypothetical protein CRG98_025573 [Punica granatum]|uniref:Uncharacterized protein n=1 Tax=Punica granatum TaxID=22663 RepID=A0A2I0JED4_PUNGR|nr:hypothetical protein CRG98_025573 [Punica granatum]